MARPHGSARTLLNAINKSVQLVPSVLRSAHRAFPFINTEGGSRFMATGQGSVPERLNTGG
jgi:hypothetical protein